MRRTLRLVLSVAISLSAAAASAGPGSPLEGSWQSDRTATLESLEAHGGFSEQQWELLRSPELFGHMIQVFQGRRAFVIFDGECTPWVPVEIEATRPDAVELRYLDESEPPLEIGVGPERIRVPILLLRGAKEVFARVSATDVAGRHACFSQRIAEPVTPAARDGAAPRP